MSILVVVALFLCVLKYKICHKNQKRDAAGRQVFQNKLKIKKGRVEDCEIHVKFS